MENSLASSLSVAEVKSQYNAHVRNILAHKEILAWILKYTTTEYKSMSIAKVKECIEGEPQIANVRVNPGETNAPRSISEKITGSMTEDNVPEEGVIYYDIRFFAYVPDKKERIKIILNVEAQKNFYPGYQIVTRGIFYGGRMISAQLGTEFEIPDYDGLKKVYSIWICMNAPKYIGNAISEYSITKEDLIQGIPDKKWAYDKMSVIVICLNEEKQSEIKLLQMLNSLLSSKKDVAEKKMELEEKFHISMENKLEKELNLMCNVADLVFDRAWKDGMEQGLKDGMEQGLKDGMERGMENKLKELVQKKIFKGLSVEAIAEILEEPIEVIQKIASEI